MEESRPAQRVARRLHRPPRQRSRSRRPFLPTLLLLLLPLLSLARRLRPLLILFLLLLMMLPLMLLMLPLAFGFAALRPPKVDEPDCEVCGKKPASSTCSGCALAHYCSSKDCRLSRWKERKPPCKEVAALKKKLADSRTKKRPRSQRSRRSRTPLRRVAPRCPLRSARAADPPITALAPASRSTGSSTNLLDEPGAM